MPVLRSTGRPNFRPAKNNRGVKPFKRPDKDERASWYPDNWEDLSYEVRQRDHWRCQAHKLFGGKPCDVYAPPPFQHMLHVHHIVPLPKGSNKKRNLITLCHDHHGQAHGRKIGHSATHKQKLAAKKF